MTIREDGSVATDVSESIDTDSEQNLDESSAPRRFNFKEKKYKILGLLAIVMAIEAFAIYFVLPKPANTTNPQELGVDPVGDEEGNASKIDTVEVKVGDFNCTNSKATTGVVHVTFTVTATVADGQKVAFEQAVKNDHEARVRQAVLQVCRSSSLEELSDPRLSVIKQQIRAKVNSVLRKSYIIEVVIGDFRTTEQ